MKSLGFVLILIALVGISYIAHQDRPSGTITPKGATETKIFEGMPIPAKIASAVTSPPPSMEDINTHPETYGTDADPKIITLGPKTGSRPDWPAYDNKHGMEFELSAGTPILAPIDMKFIGFSNNNAKYRIQNGQKIAPFNDLALYFESTDPDWPGMLIKTYHLYSSPLLLGHYQNPECNEINEWGTKPQTKGHLIFEFNEAFDVEKGNASACQARIGDDIKRGSVIGYAGSVDNHTFVSFCFKVQDTFKNPTVQKGNPYLHWVQPSTFFYWKSYKPNAIFPSGVLAYPFEADGYRIPSQERDINYKKII